MIHTLPTTKRCPRCSTDTDDYMKNSARPDGRSDWCRPCNLNRAAEYRSRPEVKARRAVTRGTHEKRVNRPDYYQKLYGITRTDYEAMHDRQQGKCLICSQPEMVRTRLACDHDHVTGAVRGLLCHQCNVGLGSFKDNSGLLNNAQDYLAGRLAGQTQ